MTCRRMEHSTVELSLVLLKICVVVDFSEKQKKIKFKMFKLLTAGAKDAKKTRRGNPLWREARRGRENPP